ncbi:unnamed protein product [Rotaria socialis]|uniref:Uncharacterized protein n=1 Tax=Rotaria socialis TaxID=392032 RepID=A0A821QHZ4_9BILA|nr:unnamed protein product [Rotaria socialis]CAF4826228.1 unnamed protein product [Rotaria socialis]
MDEFIDLPKNLLQKLLDSPGLSQKLCNQDTTNKIESILNEYLLNVRDMQSNSTTTKNVLQGQSHIYSFLFDCFVDLELISSSKFDATGNQLPKIKMKKLLTTEILSKLYQNLKCCEESISLFQLLSSSRHDGSGNELLNQIKKFLNEYPEYKNKFGIYGTTILYAAAENGNLEIIKYLIENVKCELNLQNPQVILPNGNELLSNGNTPLHAACYFEHLDIVKYFLEYQNVDLSLKNSSGQTPQMIVELNKNHLILLDLEQFLKMSEMFYIILNESSNLDEEYKEIVTKFILKDSESIQEIIEQKFSGVENEKQALVAISNIEQQGWITFAILKVSKEFFVFFVKDESSSSFCSYESKKNQIMKIIEEKRKNNFSIQVIENRNREENDEISNTLGFALALNKMKVIIEFLKDEKIKKETYKKKFEEINFSIHANDGGDAANNRRREILFNFEKSFVEQGLDETSIGKVKLEMILDALRNVMKNDKKYLLQENQLIKLANLLPKRNFSRLDGDKIDLKEIIIKILLEFKNRGQVINNRIVETNLQNYYESNKSYLVEVEKFDKILHRDFRDNEIKGCLILALNDQKEFLFSIGKIIPNLNYFDEFIQLLDDHNQKRQELEIEKIKLNRKLDILNLEEEKNNEKEIKQRKELIDIRFKISEIQKQFDYCLAKSEISQSVNIDDLIVLLGENLTDEYAFSQETINKLIEVGKRTEENEELASALIKILNFNKSEKIPLDKNRNRKEIEQVLSKLLSQISQSDKSVEIIVNLRKEFLITLNQNSNLLKFLHQLLIENQNLKYRTQALEILKLSKFYPNNLEYIERTVSLEGKCSQNDPTIVDDCLTQVKSGNKLTLNLFQKLIQDFSTHIEMIGEIIKEIVEHDVQKLPELLIQKFQEHVKSSPLVSTLSDKKNRTKTMISICKSLIKGKYLIDLNEIQPNIGDLLLIDGDENLRDEILEMVFTKFTNGDEIGQEIIEKIKSLAVKNEYAENIIKFIENSSIGDDIAVMERLVRSSLLFRMNAFLSNKADTNNINSEEEEKREANVN